jgi:hypothetical protein
MFRVRIDVIADELSFTDTYTFANSDADSVIKELRGASGNVFYITDIYGKSLFLNFKEIRVLRITLTNLPLVN